MIKQSKIKLILSITILSLITGGVVLPLDFAFSQSYSVDFEGYYLVAWGSPTEGISTRINYIERPINLPHYGRYEIRTYYNANSGQGQLYEEYKVLVDGKYIGQTSDPNLTSAGPDYENEYLGEHDFTAGNHQVRLEHRWNYSQVGSQSVHLKNVRFTLVEPANNPPYALAGPDKEVYEDESVVLAGAGSDPDGDPITYSWSCTGGSLSNRYIAQPTYTAPQVTQDTYYTCTLTVSDNKGLTDSDSMQVTVRNSILSPQVETNSASNIQINRATLNGYLQNMGGADSCNVWFQWGRTFSYGNETFHYTQYHTGTFNSTISNLSQNTTYHFRAVAENNEGIAYGIDRTFVTSQNNHPPVANAGPDKEVYEDESVRLAGAGSDPDGDPITYYWSCTGGYLSNRYTARPTFDAPSVNYDRNYTCTLTVTDDKGLSDSDSMRVRVLTQESICSKTSSSCSNPDGYIYLGDTKTGCLNNGDWKYYKVRESSGKKIKVELSWSGTGCNVNDLYIYNSNCSQIYSEENNYWTKTWEGTPSSDIIIGLDGDSSNDNCQWDLEVRSIGEEELSVAKSVQNLSRGDTKWYYSYRSADPGDELLFKIIVKSTGDTEADNVKVRDTLPSKIIYQGGLEIDGVSNSRNITETAINIGDLSPGQSKTITFEAKVAAKEKFSYGTTELINTARAYTSETSDTDTCKVKVTRKAVAGAITTVPTGITNRILDSILLPLGIALLIVWIFKSKLIGLDKWTEGRKKEIEEYRAKKTLKGKISRLKSRGTL